MIAWLLWGATFLLGLGLALYLTPLIRRAALRMGILDRPDGKLKLHGEPTPYLGGVAVYLSFLIALALVFDFDPELLGLLLGGTMMAMLGLFDDLKVLPPRVKLAGQLLAALVLLKSGIAIQLVALPAWITLPLSVLWVAGITNAVNIIDVSDGLSSSVTAVAGLALFVVASLNGEHLIAVTTLALVGSLVGFLRYNQAPAQIYLGDTGSMFVGFMLAALAMIGTYADRTVWGALAPLVILMVPVLDTLLVSAARLRRGMSPMRGSPDHFALRLKHRGWSPSQVAVYGCALSGVGGALGVAMTLTPEPITITLAAVAGALGLGNLAWWWTLDVPTPVAVHTLSEEVRAS